MNRGSGVRQDKALCGLQADVQLYAFDGHEKTIVTRGGIDPKQVNPRTMQSKLRPKLFF